MFNYHVLILQRVEEMSEIIQVREDRLLQISKENNDLIEANNILRKYVISVSM